MLNQLMQLVEQHAGNAIVNNPAIPNLHNGAAIQHVAEQIFNGLQNRYFGQSKSASLFQSGSSVGSHPIVSQLISSVAGSVANQFGVFPSAAQSMASNLLPTVMSQLVSKTNNPNDNSFDLSNMMQTFTGNNHFDVQGTLSQITGGHSGGIGGMLGKLFE